jgi:hypothetical protein
METQETAAAPAVSEGNAVTETVSTPVATEAPRSFEERASNDMAAVFDRLNPHEKVSRSETGQFESKAPTEDTTETQGQTPPEQVQSEPVTAIAHPQSMPAELRDKWGTVPPEVAKWVSTREAESHKRITELGEAAKTGEQIRSVIGRYQQSFRGVPVEQGLDKLLAANAYLERDPVEALQWLANAYGVNLSGLGQTAQGEQGQESGEVRALNAKIAQLERQISDTSNRVMSREQREEHARQQTIEKLAEDFAKDKQDHWSDIEQDVIDQLAAVAQREPDLPPKERLEKAYKNALKVNDAVATKLNEAQRKAEAQKAEADKKRKADEAKKHASLNVKSANAATPKQAKWEDTMREVADRIYG